MARQIDAKTERVWRSYTNRVLSYLNTSYGVKKQIREDLRESLEERWLMGDERSPEEMIGPVAEVAAEFAENLGIPSAAGGSRSGTFEYKSKANVFGIPLVHIILEKYGATPGTPLVARGILAIGPIAIGVLSFGGIGLGVFSIGGIGIGLLTAMGGMAVSGLLSLGGMAVSAVAAMGGLAVGGQFAAGGLGVSAGFALGEQSIGRIAAYTGRVNINSEYIRYAFRLPGQAEELMRCLQAEMPVIFRVFGSLLRMLI